MSIVPINDAVGFTDADADASDDPLAGLSLKQRLFLEYYLADANGVGYKAAQMAGYEGDKRTLAVAASRLLQHPIIRACLRARVQEMVPIPLLLNRIVEIAGRNVSDVGLNAQVKALELGLRLHGLLIDRIEHSGTTQHDVRQITITLTGDAATKQD